MQNIIDPNMQYKRLILSNYKIKMIKGGEIVSENQMQNIE